MVLAEMQVAVGQVAEAREHFEHLLRQRPDHPSARFGLARCLARTGQPEKVRELFDRLLEEYPDDWKALGERGALALGEGRPAEAETPLRRAATLAPFDLPSQTRLAQCLRLLKKMDEWRGRCRLGRTNSAPTSPGRNGSALRFARSGRTTRTCATNWRACSSAWESHRTPCTGSARRAGEGPDHRPSHEVLAQFYEQAGQFEQAAAHCAALRRMVAKR